MIALKWLGITAAAFAALALFIVDYAVTGGLFAVVVAGVGLTVAWVSTSAASSRPRK